MRLFKRNGSWYGDVRDPVAGDRKKRRRKWKISKKKAVAKVVAEKFEDNMTKASVGIPIEPPKPIPLFRDYAQVYLRDSEQRKSLKSFKRDVGIVHNYFLTPLGAKRLDEITVGDVEDLKTAILSQWSVGDAIKKMNLFQAMMNYAVYKCILPENHPKDVKKLDTPPERVRYLKKDERQRLIEPMTTPWYLLSVALIAIHTALRRGDHNIVGGVVNLRWADIDLDAKIITLSRTKSRKRHVVPLNKTMLALFAKLPKTDERVVPGVNGNMVTMAFKRACERAHVTDFHFHDLRHTFGSYLAMAKYNMRTIQELMGHSDPRMTAKYMHLADEHKREAVDGLDEIFGM